MKKNKSILVILSLCIMLMNTLYYLSIKPIWFFIDKELGVFLSKNNFWSSFILALLLIFISYLMILIIRKPRYIKSKIHSVLILLVTFLFVGLNIYLFTELGSEKTIVIRNLIKMFPNIMISLLIIFFILIYPKLNLSNNSTIKYTITGILLAILLILNMNVGDVKITSGPYFQYVDDNTVAIMWTTNKNSTGWIEYGKSKDSLNKHTMSTNGIIHGNTKVHKVLIDNTLIDNKVFRVGSRKIKDYFQNNIVYGNTVYSNYLDYKDNRQNDNTSFYILSDVHERRDIYSKYLSNDDFDFVVLNGDLISSVDDEKILVDELLEPISNSIEGFKPFYFVRGNHETRGAASKEMINYLALPNNKYYYTFSYGPIFFIVLDSGEDKLDSHEEYGGLADYESYKEEETKWLEKVYSSKEYKDAKYTVAFSHIPLNTYSSKEDSYIKDYESKWVSILNNIEIDVLFSGHTHKSTIIPEGDIINFPIYVGGGYGKAKNGYEAIKVEIIDGIFSIIFVDENGNRESKQIINN